jgi:cell division protein FtsB
MSEFIAKYWLEFGFGLLTTGALAFCRHLWKQNKELARLQKEEENRKYRQMIIDEIEPIIEELGRAEEEIKSIKEKGAKTIEGVEASEEQAHELMYKDLKKIQAENERRFALILNSYKFRLIQLCKLHLKDGFITTEDYAQVSEMHELYKSLGGNGQAEEYFEKVKRLENEKKEEDK